MFPAQSLSFEVSHHNNDVFMLGNPIQDSQREINLR